MILTQVDQGSTTVNINAVLQQTESNISLFVFNRYICQRPGGFCKVSIFFFFFFLSQHHINNFTKKYFVTQTAAIQICPRGFQSQISFQAC